MAASKNQVMKAYFIVLFAVLLGCNSTTKQTHKQDKPVKSKKETLSERYNQKKITINSSPKSTSTIDDPVNFIVDFGKIPLPDSILLSVDFKHEGTYTSTNNISWLTKNEIPGQKKIQLIFYWGDTISTSRVLDYTLLSDIVPKIYTYKVKKTWPHNPKSYTQGLEFCDGFLYEGTGQYGESMLSKLNLDKNEVLQSVNLPDDVFGEGITILKDKVYELTWRSNIGYVYEKSDLKELYEFNYPTEGWGLTNNGTDLIMSDGSENIYFLDTEMIQEKNKIQIYDNKGPIKNLNELEYIDGIIYANVYQTDLIVAFDAKSGKVLKRIDLTGLLNKDAIKTPVDVLNGIAWDKNNKRFIVTGKWWPTFFQIELIEKK